MKHMNFFGAFLLLGVLSGCVSAGDKTEKLSSSYALKGTSTAVVGIAVDKTGLPLETVKEVVLYPGQKVIFAGPDRFFISFKDKKSPSRKIKYESVNGVVTVAIPKDILDKPEFVEEFRKNKYLKFNYAITVNGKELDPPLIVKRQN
jgi:hypothetical protein